MIPIDCLQDSHRAWLLDGGLATELERRGHTLSSRLWSAERIISDIESIGKCHHAFLSAGAQIITTASYQAALPGLREYGLSHEEALGVLHDSVAIACRERDTYFRQTGKPALVAASVGPYGAYLADGSEYSGNYGLDVGELVDFHGEQAGILSRTRADLLAFETVPDYKEALALARILERTAKPSWVSFCCRDSARIQDGTPIETVARLFADIACVFAVGINCTAPVHISPLIHRLRFSAPNKTIVVYPNSGEHYRCGIWHGDTEPFEDNGIRWLQDGARIIGGCCRIGPEQISALADRLKTVYQGSWQNHLYRRTN